MLLTDLHNKYSNQSVYIVGTGPTLSLFPKDFFVDKNCIFLNNAYKITDNVGPIGLFHSVDYIYDSNSFLKLIPNNEMDSIVYPIIKLSKNAFDILSERDFPFYFYYFSHEINLFNPYIITNEIFYTKDGSSLHAALQVANIIGVTNIFICGCDARTFSGKHYGSQPKDSYRSKEDVQRDYDSYTLGSVHIISKLRKKGIVINNLSPLIGYNSLDYQYDFFNEC